MPIDERGTLFVISGPSASGKGTAIRAAVADLGLARVTTYTTRQRRDNEVDGHDYNFIGVDEFLGLVADGGIFEYSQPYHDAYYGSPSAILDQSTEDAITELDPRGYFRVRASSARRVVGIFVYPGPPSEVSARLEVRADTPAAENRVRVVNEQLEQAIHYDYVLFNEVEATFLEEIHTILQVELLRARYARALIGLRHRLDATLQ